MFTKIDMASTTKARTSSFSRYTSTGPTSQVPDLKPGPNGALFLSFGIPDLDRILGGGFCLGSLIIVMEDPEAPHNMLLLRNFMAQSALLYASPSKDPKGFLGTLPNPMSLKDDKPWDHGIEQDKDLRIAWQYKKYSRESQSGPDVRDLKHKYCNNYDLRKPLERQYLGGKQIDCLSTQDLTLDVLHQRCSSFLAQNLRSGGSISCGGRVAIQSLCAPQSGYFDKDWDRLAFIRNLKAFVKASNAVTMITFPPSLLSASFSKRWQHLADTLLSVKAIPDEDKELAQLLTGYHEMVGFLSIHKVARFNTQVPLVLKASTFSIKLHKRRSLVLECLNQAPIDGASGASYGTSSSCSASTKQGSLDF